MCETNIESFNFKPLTLYSFYPKDKHLKLSNKASNMISKEYKANNENNEHIYKERNNSNKKKKILNGQI